MKRIYIFKIRYGDVIVWGEPFYYYNQGVNFSIWSRGRIIIDLERSIIDVGKNITDKKKKNL